MASVTHDGGKTWSTPQVISGSLDQAFVSTPVVAADGSIFVSFLNTTDLTTGRDDYEVVRVDPSTGTALGAPVKVATVIDGVTDYPIAFGSQTYHDSLFRSWAAGNIAADPTDPSHLAVVWSDMRNSPTPAPADPYAATTNSDVIVSQSFNGGQTWSTPVALAPERRPVPAVERLRYGRTAPDRNVRPAYDPANRSTRSPSRPRRHRVARVHDGQRVHRDAIRRPATAGSRRP